MRKRNKKNILPQMFDVLPSDAHGNLDLEKIGNVGKVKDAGTAQLRDKKSTTSGFLKSAESQRIFTDIITDSRNACSSGRKIKKSFGKRKGNQVFQFGEFFDSENVPVFHESQIRYREFSFVDRTDSDPGGPDGNQDAEIFRENESFSEKMVSFDELLLKKHIRKLRIKKAAWAVGTAAAAFTLFFSGVALIRKGMELKDSVLNNGSAAYASLLEAKDGIISGNFEKTEFEFGQARDEFAEISKDIDSMGNFFVEASRFVPFISRVSSGSYLAKVGRDISDAGAVAGNILKTLDGLKNPLEGSQPVSFLSIFQDTSGDVKNVVSLLESAEANLAKVSLDDVPEDKRSQFSMLKEKLPEIKRLLSGFLRNSDIFVDVLGGNGPRKYLFLFQNNQEMRATGGFIGSYAALDISNGRVKKFFIDGIFNPDGQLREKVVPPEPIQKISAAWSLHDSNWFPDFPVSAEKASWFYEKTGGPTVDGIITMTPTVMEKLLEITGPIDMPEYDVMVDKENFIEKIQYEVEIDYDREINEPKQILSDLAPRILDRILNSGNLSDIARTTDILVDSLNEKHILIYSKNYEIERKISERGWSGEILDANRDYVSVINSNINGFKTDGVIEEEISHVAEIQRDGSIIDTLTVTRRHTGGNTGFDWWDRVNADYMRVYVPKGSQLLSAEGHTREMNSPPLDYDALSFKRDPQVQTNKDSMMTDSESGTQIFEDAGKTVFGNWVYVSPQETATVKYRYLLPFKISMGGASKPADAYSLLAQKQSGSRGSRFVSKITFPEAYKIIWKYPFSIKENGGRTAELSTDLKTDKFIGLAFTE